MPRVQEYFTRGKLVTALAANGGWEFQLTGAARLPREGRFWIAEGHRYFAQFCMLLQTVRANDKVEIAVKTSTPISPDAPAEVEFMQAVPRDGLA